jgi:CRP-like cAMP-binding protein
MLDAFIAHMRTIHPVSDELEAAFQGMDILEVPRHEYLLREGQRADYGFIMLKGLVRSYYLKDGEEICSRFMQEQHIVISVHSFYGRHASYEYIEALEDSVVARMHYDQLQQLYRTYPEFNYIGRVLTEHYFSLSEQRLYLLRKQSAEERYRFFIEHYPEWLQRVPLKYIATFLGMNLETLSRIRKKISTSR